MKNTMFAIALAAVGFAAAPLTSHAADDHSGFFINGNVGQSSLDKGAFDDDDTAFGGNVGYRWAVGPSVLLGIEGGYTDLGQWDAKHDSLGDTKAELKGWNLGANGHFNVTDNWYVSGRAGWFRGDRTIKGSFLPGKIDDTKDGWYAGAGFGYDFNTNVSLGLNYDYYKVDKNDLDLSPGVVSVSAEYRF
jgi:opacity protein-like surface antigen